jgi:anti-anti-sigma factor
MMLDIQVFTPKGNFDGKDSPQLRVELTNLALKKPDVLIIDMQNVALIDSNGLGVLFSMVKLVRANQGRLIICALNEQARFLLEVTSTANYFEIFSNQAEAIAAIQNS